MKTFCHLIGKYFGIIAVVFLILGMTVPDSFKWVVGNIGGIPVLSTLLGVIMFGMGTTLNLRDFALVLKRPVDVFVGVCAQYLIMPSLAFLLAMAFNLDPALTAGVVLVGTCPGGTSSNVINALLCTSQPSFLTSSNAGFTRRLGLICNYDQCFHTAFTDSYSAHHLSAYRTENRF